MPEINEINKKVKSDPTGCCSCCFSKSRSKKMFDESTNSIIDQTVSDVASSTSIQSETVPYSSPVSNLKPGKVIRIQGLAHPRCSRFSVDFLSSLTHKSDIVFHLNPRLSQKYIVRNSCLNGRWGVEETTSIHKFSFERNKIFKLDIFCTEREFLISLNGKYICAFVYRAPLPSITTIEIRGLVEVYGVDFGEAQSYPETAPENVPIIATVGAEQTIMDKQQEMELPATRLLPDGFLPGWQLEIYGRVKLLPHSFYINLQEGYQMWPHPIVHLHLNPRFSITTGDRMLVRNAWLDGEWGREERVPLFQFTPGSPFVMTISRMDDHFAVWVDSKLTGEFKFRRNPDKIDSIYLQGDITLMRVGLRRPTTMGRSLPINGDGCICDDTVVTDTEECTCTDSNTQVSTTADCPCGDDATHTNTSTHINNPDTNTNTNAGDDNVNRTTNTTIYSDANDRTRRSDDTNTTVYTDADDHTRRQGDTSASVYTDAGDYTLRRSDINATVSTDAGDHTGIHGDTSINTTTNTNTTNTNTTNTSNTTTSNDTNNTNNPDTIDTTNTNTTHTTGITNATDVTDTTDTTNTNTTAYSDAND